MAESADGRAAGGCVPGAEAWRWSAPASDNKASDGGRGGGGGGGTAAAVDSDGLPSVALLLEGCAVDLEGVGGKQAVEAAG
eukprot:364878-Chlamydomonas_euryale.AAC.7